MVWAGCEVKKETRLKEDVVDVGEASNVVSVLHQRVAFSDCCIYT